MITVLNYHFNRWMGTFCYWIAYQQGKIENSWQWFEAGNHFNEKCAEILELERKKGV